MDRFPADDFMFELTENEIDVVVSQNVIPHKKYLGGSNPSLLRKQGLSCYPVCLKARPLLK